MSLFSKAFMSLALAVLAVQAQATPIVVAGDRFSITYDDAQVGLYKPALLSGSQDTVYFLPSAFVAVANNAPASLQAGLQFTLSIDPGYVFAGLGFAESGNYILARGGSASAAANVQLLDLDTLASDGLLLDTGALGAVGGTTAWAISGALGTHTAGAQNLQITLGDTLTSEPVGGIGLIRKSYVGFTVHTREVQAVPEPSGLALMLAGLFAAWTIGRRRVRA